MADKVERADFGTDMPRRLVEVRDGEFAPEVVGVAALTGPGDQVGRNRFDAEVRRRFVEVRTGEFAPEVVIIGSTGVSTLVLNVRDAAFGAVGDGATVADGAAIQAAIDAADTAGTDSGVTEVLVPAGTYLSDLRLIPNLIGGTTTVAACVWLRSNVKLTFEPGAVLKLKDGATLPATTTQAHILSTVDPYGLTLPRTKANIHVSGVAIDGNANNNTGFSPVNIMNSALFIGSTDGAWVQNCKVKNFHGTLSAPPGETFHFEANYSKNVHFIDCEADGSGATDSSTGFSTNNSFGVTWSGCIAHDLNHGMGFTCWQSAGLRYSNCHAYKCTGVNSNGFNAERSRDITYAGCVSGGLSQNVGADTVFPWHANGANLGNQRGFGIHGCTNVTATGCQSNNNVTDGIRVYSNAGVSPTLACNNVVFNGVVLFGNATPVAIDDSVLPQVGVWVGEAGLGTDDIIRVYANAPFTSYHALGSGLSGVRWDVGSGFGNHAFRWTIGGVTALRAAGGTPPTGGDAGVVGRAGDLTATWNLRGESIGTKLITGAGRTTIADADFAHVPADGAIGYIKDSTTGVVYRCVRVADAWIVTAEIGEPVDGDRLTVGESTMSRRDVSSLVVTTGNQSLRLAYFTARKTETVTQVRMMSGTTAAGATPTLVRSGVYSVAANGDLTLVGSIVNDTAIFAAASTRYTRSLSASFVKTVGQRYAFGTLVVTGATAPTLTGMAGTLVNAESGEAPRISGLVAGQTDLPSSITAGSIADSATIGYSVVLP